MSTNLFHTFLLLLFIACCACQCAYAEEITSSGGSKSVELFKTKEQITGIIKPDNGESEGTENITPSAFYFPFIVAANDVMVALTGVNRTDDNSDDQKYVDILTKYIRTKEDDWFKKATSDAGWKKQFAVKEENQQKKYVVKGLAAAAKENKMYLLLLNKTAADDSDQNCGIKLVEGTISTENAENIEWKTTESNSLSEEPKKCLAELQPINYLLASSVYLEKTKNIVFVVHAKSNGSKKNKFVFAYLDDTAKTNGVKLSCKGTAESNCHSAFFPWGDKIMMIPTRCGENSESKLFVNKSSDMGEKWTESVEPFGRLLDFLQDKNDFTTTTTVNDSNILLFTQQKLKTTTGGENEKKYDVHLWFTDGDRVQTAGRIVTDDNITSSRLLHTKGELLGLYQNISNNQPANITLTRLDAQLENITTVITAWKDTDNIVKSLFKITPESYSITDGLVGFLSKNGDNNNWKDEYLYVNATVTGGDKVDSGGFKFEGKNKCAKWPVGKLEDQPYNFTGLGFTLVANVTIEKVPTGDNGNSVLGVGYNVTDNAKKTVGLRCTKGGEWELTDNENPKKTLSNKVKCQEGRAYVVSLILNQNKLFVHIDGEQPGENGKEITIEQAANITHFYFGAADETNDVESHVTVTNVLLYNRPLFEDVIKQLKTSKDEKPKQKEIDTKIQNSSDGINTRENKETPKGGLDDRKGTSDQSNDTADNNNNEETLSSTPEDSTVRGGVVGVLLFLFLLPLNACM